MSEIRPFTRFIESLNRRNLVGAEIGVMGGANALTFLEILDIERLYLIDVFDTYLSFSGHGVLQSKKVGDMCYNGAKRTLSKYEDKLVWLVGLSENVVDDIHKELDFVYIDGNHRYEFVKKDINLYYTKIKQGGIIGGHDYKSDEPGVIAAVNESFQTSKIKKDKWDWWVVKE